MRKPLALLFAIGVIVCAVWLVQRTTLHPVSTVSTPVEHGGSLGAAAEEAKLVDVQEAPKLTALDPMGHTVPAVEHEAEEPKVVPDELGQLPVMHSGGPPPAAEDTVAVKLRAVGRTGAALGKEPITLRLELFAEGSRLTSRPPADLDAEPVTGGSQTQLTDGNGRLRFRVSREFLPDLMNVVTVLHRQEHRIARFDQVTVPPKSMSMETVDLGDVALLLPRELYPNPLVSGIVVDHEGAPLGDALQALEGVIVSQRVADSRSTPSRGESQRTVQQLPQRTEWPFGTSGEVVIEADGFFAVHAPESLSGKARAVHLDFLMKITTNRTLVTSVTGIAPGTRGLEVRLRR